MSYISEFKEFLFEYKVIGLAVAFIMGVATTGLVKSLVDNIIMPIIAIILPAGSWQSSTISIGPIVFGIGAFLSELINFVIIAMVVFVVAKKVLKEEKVTKK